MSYLTAVATVQISSLENIKTLVANANNAIDADSRVKYFGIYNIHDLTKAAVTTATLEESEDKPRLEAIDHLDGTTRSVVVFDDGAVNTLFEAGVLQISARDAVLATAATATTATTATSATPGSLRNPSAASGADDVMEADSASNAADSAPKPAPR